MSEKENLTPFQIQLLLYYLTAEPSKRTVTDSARSLNVSKWVVTRTLDTLEKLNIVERLENRKTVLTVPGVKLAEKYQKQKKVLEKYMQYQDIPPAQIKDNAFRALAAGFSDEFMERLAEQEKVTPLELFKGLFVAYNENVATIFDLRFPRIFIAMFGGAAMAVSGVLLQAVMKNPLADPGIIGISSGASLVAVLITAFFPALYFFTPLFAFLGGMIAFLLVYSLSWKGGLSPCASFWWA